MLFPSSPSQEENAVPTAPFPLHPLFPWRKFYTLLWSLPQRFLRAFLVPGQSWSLMDVGDPSHLFSMESFR